MSPATLNSRFFSIFVLVLFLPSAALAQYGASLQGTVTDKTGAVIPGANVTITDQATGVTHSAVTGPEGFYRITGLPPGSYTVDVEAASFKKSSTPGVQVASETASAANVTLEGGSNRETVTVSGAPPSLQTENATVSGTISSAEVESLPEIDRDPYELLRLAPGVMGDGARFGDGRSAGFPNGSGAVSASAGPGGSNTAIFQVENQQPISANGQRVTSNDYLVDGVSVNSLEWGGAAVITPSIESVQEISVLSNDYDASDGRSSGAHIKTITKSGTNALHGGGVFLYHDPNLNAYNKFGGYDLGVGFTPTVRDDDAFRQFAATLGGPIIKNKVFFFFNYEGLRARNTTFQNEWLETPQLDALIASDRAGTPVATILQQPGLAPRIKQLLPPSCALWVIASEPCAVVGTGVDIGSPYAGYGTYNPSFTSTNPAQFVGGGLDGIADLEYAQTYIPATTSGNQYNARVDYNAGKNLFSVNTFLTFYNTISGDASSGARPMDDLGTKNFSPSGFLSWVRTINATTLNEARFNFTRYGYNGITSNPQVNWAIPQIKVQGLPISGQNIFYGAQQGDDSPGILAQNTFSFRDVLSKVIGNKAFKFGFEFNREQDNDSLIGGARPQQVFQGFWNFANGTPIFEQIEVNPLTGAAPVTRGQFYRTSDYGAFVQDDWKLRPNLTVNVGLRWEFYAPPTEADGHLANFEPTSDPVNGLLDGHATNPSQMWNPTWRNFGPRLGFAWSPMMYNNNIVFRGGFGMAFDRFDNNTFDNTRNNPPYVASYGICCGTEATGFGTPFVNGQIDFNLGTSNNPQSYPANPALITPINPANGLPTILTGQSAPNIYSTPTDMPVPYVYLYSFQIQDALSKNWIFTMGYQGSAGHHLLRIKNLAFFYPNLNPDVGNVYQFTPDTNTNFNALNSQLEHRFTHGLSANIQYTWSKSLDQISSEGPGFVTNQTYPTDDATERGPSDYDATHNFRAYAVWDLPNFSNHNGVLAKVVGGWQLNGIFQFHSGFPWTPVASNLCPVLGATTLCPVRPVAYNGQASQDHDTSAFLPPVSGDFPALANVTSTNPLNPYFTLQTSGTTPDFPGIGRNSFRGPRYQDIDLTIAKEFGLPTMKAIGENAKIQLRMTAYNAFNKLNLTPFSFGSTSTTISSNNNGGAPFANQLFGTATSALAGRVLELQARFSF
ncbi:MAG: carboxypeptidase regulatory-like domain-containing protein [Candidatus Sulfotelmatobacter sp.]